MFGEILKREKSRVFLGELAVAPRTDIKRFLDQWGMLKTENLDSNLRHSLKEIFSLPSPQDIKEPKNTDLVLDIVVPKIQPGDAWDLSLGEVGFPIIWRPKITISSRLYYLKTEKTKATFSVTEKMRFSQYIGRLFTWRAILRFRPVFDYEDMEYLLYQACHKLLKKIKKQHDL